MAPVYEPGGNPQSSIPLANSPTVLRTSSTPEIDVIITRGKVRLQRCRRTSPILLASKTKWSPMLCLIRGVSHGSYAGNYTRVTRR